MDAPLPDWVSMYVCSDPCGLWIASSCEVVFSVGGGRGGIGGGVGEIMSWSTIVENTRVEHSWYARIVAAQDLIRNRLERSPKLNILDQNF